MRYRPLQALHAVIEKGTVTAAAHSLGISQPAISNLLAQLQDHTKLKLFERKNGRLVPTPEANILYREIDTVVRGLSQVDLAISNLQSQRLGTLQVACTHALSFGFMTSLVSDFVREYPDVDVSFQTRYSQNIQQWVLSGLTEIGISELPVLEKNLEWYPMRFICQLAIPEDSPLADLEEVRPRDLDNVPFIEMGEDHMISYRTRELFINDNSRLRVKCQSHLFRSLLEFVKNGLGVALIDPFTLANDDGAGYVVRPFKPDIFIDMALIHHKTRPVSELGMSFFEKVREEMHKYSASEPSGNSASLD
ncbi:MAG: LysR family transcriptional regulator [Sneathiella sp.]